MEHPDPFDFPEIRPKHAETRPLSVKDDNSQLAQLWISAWIAKRDAEARMSELRKQIEKRLEHGEFLGTDLGYVAWESSTKFRADPRGLHAELGSKVFLDLIEIPSSRLKELVERGQISQDTPWLSRETVRKLVTRLR